MPRVRNLALVGMLFLIGAQAARDKRSFVSLGYRIEIDGVGTATVNTVSGGYVTGEVVTAQSGADMMPQKHIGAARVVPVSVDVAPGELSTWITQSLNGNAQPVSGRIVEMDSNFSIVSERNFHDAVLTEVTFPALDASSKDAARITLTFQPQRVTVKKGDGSKTSGIGGKDTKRATLSAFRVTIPGVDCTGVTKVEAVTIKFKLPETASAGTGAAQTTKAHAGSPSAGDLVLSVAAEKVAGFAEWVEDTLANLGAGQEKEKTVTVELLSPDMKSTLLTLEGSGVGIYALRPPGGGGADQPKRAQAQMYVERWQLK